MATAVIPTCDRDETNYVQQQIAFWDAGAPAYRWIDWINARLLAVRCLHRQPGRKVHLLVHPTARRRGSGRGDRLGPLSPALSPLVPRGERVSLASTASS